MDKLYVKAHSFVVQHDLHYVEDAIEAFEGGWNAANAEREANEAALAKSYHELYERQVKCSVCGPLQYVGIQAAHAHAMAHMENNWMREVFGEELIHPEIGFVEDGDAQV